MRVQADIPLHGRAPVWKWTLCDTHHTVCPLPAENATRLPGGSELGRGNRRSRTPCPYDAYPGNSNETTHDTRRSARGTTTRVFRARGLLRGGTRAVGRV